MGLKKALDGTGETGEAERVQSNDLKVQSTALTCGSFTCEDSQVADVNCLIDCPSKDAVDIRNFIKALAKERVSC